MNSYRSEDGKLSLFTLILVGLLSAFIPLAILGWQEVYNKFLERNPPKITLESSPRGIGLAPVRIIMRFEDTNSGLDEIVVRAKQRGREKEIERIPLGGAKEFPLRLEFPGKESGFEEGDVLIEARAFDRSIWSNRAEEVLRLKVDFQKPIVEVLTQQHNARVGGSQLLMYRAIDENLTVSGVRVGNRVFEGYPARLLDDEIEDENIYMVLYAVPIEYADQKKIPMRVFAEDVVGNPRSETFYSRENPRKIRKRKVYLNSTYLRSTVHPLAEQNTKRIGGYLTDLGEEFEFKTPSGGSERYLEEFQLLNKHLRAIDSGELRPAFGNSRFRRYWTQPFLAQAGNLRYGYGEQLVFFDGDRAIDENIETAYTYRARSKGSEVIAANDGIVVFSERRGIYGFAIGIDHGLGLFSLYANLERGFVGRGDTVEIGDIIGEMGKTGLIEARGVTFQMYVQGHPVDPAEWISKTWFNDHISQKIRDVKRMLGITVLEPF